MRKNDGWINALFALIFIAAPALVIFFFFLPGWTGEEPINYGIIWAIAIGFLLYVALFSWLLIHFEWLAIQSLNFNIPIALALMTILVTHPLPLWATGLFVLVAILLAFPVNMMTTRIVENKIAKMKKGK